MSIIQFFYAKENSTLKKSHRSSSFSKCHFHASYKKVYFFSIVKADYIKQFQAAKLLFQKPLQPRLKISQDLQKDLL